MRNAQPAFQRLRERERRKILAARLDHQADDIAAMDVESAIVE